MEQVLRFGMSAFASLHLQSCSHQRGGALLAARATSQLVPIGACGDAPMCKHATAPLTDNVLDPIQWSGPEGGTRGLSGMNLAGEAGVVGLVGMQRSTFQTGSSPLLTCFSRCASLRGFIASNPFNPGYRDRLVRACHCTAALCTLLALLFLLLTVQCLHSICNSSADPAAVRSPARFAASGLSQSQELVAVYSWCALEALENTLLRSTDKSGPYIGARRCGAAVDAVLRSPRPAMQF